MEFILTKNINKLIKHTFKFYTSFTLVFKMFVLFFNHNLNNV